MGKLPLWISVFLLAYLCISDFNFQFMDKFLSISAVQDWKRYRRWDVVQRWSKCHGEVYGPFVSWHLVVICIFGHLLKHFLSLYSWATGLTSWLFITSNEMFLSVAWLSLGQVVSTITSQVKFCFAFACCVLWELIPVFDIGRHIYDIWLLCSTDFSFLCLWELALNISAPSHWVSFV